MTDETAAAAPPTINRELVARDLEVLSILVAPAIEARLTTLRTIPVVGPMLYNRLRGSPRAMTSAALSSLLDLTDEDLAALVDLVGRELGAWRGFNAEATMADADVAYPAYGRLVAVLEDQ